MAQDERLWSARSDTYLGVSKVLSGLASHEQDPAALSSAYSDMSQGDVAVRMAIYGTQDVRYYYKAVVQALADLTSGVTEERAMQFESEVRALQDAMRSDMQRGP